MGSRDHGMVELGVQIPLAPFSPSAKIEGREEWGESRKGIMGFINGVMLKDKKPLPGLLTPHSFPLRIGLWRSRSKISSSIRRRWISAIVFARPLRLSLADFI